MKKLFIFTLLLAGCAAPSIAPSSSKVSLSLPAAGPEENLQSNLTREEAIDRASRVANVRYRLLLSLEKSPSYSGEEIISFDLKNSGKDIRLDFFLGDIRSLEINGKSSPVQRTSTYLMLPGTLLQKGPNLVKLSFTTKMQTNGTGLHYFVDPADGNIYIHTQFEAFSAHKFMPCFDQPDLKSTLQLQVTAPKAWVIVSTTREFKIEPQGDFQKWYFPETAPISTYLFSLHGGPFKVWQDNFGKIPLRLFARPSLAKYVHPELWFQATKQGLGFYNKFFSYPYPFQKYDQLLIPEFNSGAMENVGAVTFSERYIKRGKVTRDDELNTVDTLLHEMAHMWFGDLVTMRWWNDLWLNESFATYMSALATFEATKYKESWREFHGLKGWAYYQDQLSTTHPIEGHVADTNEAFSSFDGITYGKGAAVLKQMSRWLTPENFQKGVQDYMKTHAFKNTSLADFIASLQKFSERDLTAWSKAWLQQSGVDTARVNFTCQGDKLDTVTIDTTASVPAAAFRPQSVILAFFSERQGRMEITDSKPVEIEKAHQEFRFDVRCPSLVYPNYEDHGYMKVALNSTAVESLKNSLSSLKDPLTRTMLWGDAWEMVRGQEIALSDYAEIVNRQFASETDEKVLRAIVRSISGSPRDDSETLIGYWPTTPESMKAQRNALIEQLEKIYAAKMSSASPGSDFQTFWWDSLVQIAQSGGNQHFLSGILEGSIKAPAGLELDQDRRWAATKRLCRLGHPNCEQIVDRELKKDGSDRGLREALGARALRPDLSSKEKLMREALQSTALSLQNKTAITKNLFPYEQRFMAEKLEGAYFDYIRANKAKGEIETLRAFADTLAPINCDARQSRKIQGFLDGNSDLPKPIQRLLREILDDDIRCQKIRAKLMEKTQGV